MNDWPDHPYHYGDAVDPVNVNRFPQAPGGDLAADRKRGRAVANMCWQLVSMMSVFFNSMDYLYRPVSYTPSRTQLEGDGKVRLILGHDDPGYYNWLDTQGFERGNVTHRHLLSDASTTFNTRLVKRAELAHELPAQAVRVTQEQRIAQLHARFAGIRRRFGL